MFDFLSIMPFSFWAVVLLLIGGSAWAWTRMRDGIGIPMLAVLGTVAFWYVGDAWYNDYAGNHVQLFPPPILAAAWWQVAWFIVVFVLFSTALHAWINARQLPHGSGMLKMFHWGVNHPQLQYQLRLLFLGSVILWLILALIALVRLKGGILYYLFPFLGYNAEPWGRGRIGSGFDALLSLAFYFQLLVAGIFGVVAALATNRRLRFWALTLCALAWPYFIFSRTRNTLLAAVIPGILSYALLRIRGGLWKKGAVLVGFFIVVNAWMAFIIANRSASTIVAAFREKGFSLRSEADTRHLGLNMYEELCWVNTFIKQGTYQPNWGARYFAEAVNIIPRSLWKGKPLIGIDYAIARGQEGGEAGAAGVYATISTGFIGQGVVNFGLFFGPAAAALLMSLWTVILARLDLEIHKLGRIPLYACGLILTFNLGRDITLITLYPFVFGSAAIWWLQRYYRTTSRRSIGPKRLIPRPARFSASDLSQSSSLRQVNPRGMPQHHPHP